MVDRFGLSYRAAFIAGVLEHLEEIDVLEMLADDLVSAPRRVIQATQALARERPLILHGVSIGFSGSEAIETKRLDRVASLCEQLGAETFGEHLAFVRAGGIEIGHMAASPRTDASVEASCRNLQKARSILGFSPIVENIASLIVPPLSTMDEPTWLNHITAQSGSGLLLDLHNLYANAGMIGADPFAMLLEINLQAVTHVHLAGGRILPTQSGRPRILDDHLHAVPPVCFAMLELLAAHASQPLTVVLERDGAFPAFSELMGELAKARAAVARGRSQSERQSA